MTKKIKQVKSYFPVLLLILCVAWFGLWLFRIVQNIGMPQIEYSEGFMLYNAKLFTSGKWVWDINAGPPFTTSFYTPVFYYLLGLFGNTLVGGRILVVLSTFICMVLIFWIVRRMRVNSLICGVAALLPLTQYVFTGWSLFVRVDMTAVMFELIGIYLVVRFKNTPWLLLSIPFFALAFYTKQAVVAGVIGTVIYLALTNWRFAITYTATALAVILVPLFVINNATGGGFIREIFLYTQSYPAFRDFKTTSAYLIVAYIPMLPLWAIAIITFIRDKISIITTFALTALVLNLFLMTRSGASQVYFFEVIAAMSIAAGVGLPYIVQERKRVYQFMFLIPLWAFVFNFQLMTYPDSGYVERYQEAVSVIRDARYPILTENAGLVLDAGKEPYYEPFVFMQLSHLGYWNQDIVIRDLDSNRIEYVITSHLLPSKDDQRIDTAVQNEIVSHYHVVLDHSKTNYGFVVYEANNRGR